MKYCQRKFLVPASIILILIVAVWWMRMPVDPSPTPSAASESISETPSQDLTSAEPTPVAESTSADPASHVVQPALIASTTTAPVPQTEQAWQTASPSPIINAFGAWTDRYLNAPDDGTRQSLVSEGIFLAHERRRALFHLIQDDPKQALAGTVPLAVRAALPVSIETLLEERVSGRGDLEVYCVNPLPGEAHDHDAYERTATIHDIEYRAFVYGSRSGHPSKEDIPLHGIALQDGRDRVLALSENPVRELEASEVAAYLEQQSATSLAGSPCAWDAHPIAEGAEVVLMDVGGTVQVACSHEHVAALSEDLLTAADLGQPQGGEPSFDFPRSTGRKRVIMYRIAFADIPTPALSQGAAESLIVEMNDYWKEITYGMLTIAPAGEGSDIVQVSLAGNGADYDDSHGRLRDETEAAARAQGYDLTQYDFRVFFTGSLPSYPWCGLGTVGGGNPWSMVRCLNVGVTMHELGHNLSFPHGNFWNTDNQSAMGPGENDEYGDSFDVMGSSGSAGHHAVKYKNQVGWISNEDYPWISTSGRYRVFAQDNFDSYGLRGLRYRPTSALSWSHDDVSLEFREDFTSNPWLMRGLGVRWGYSGGSDRSQLVDTTPGSENGKNDSPIVIGRTFADVDSDVYITPVGFGNTYPQSLDVIVNFGPFPANQAPDVTVHTSSDSADIGGPVTLTATASDPDGDELAYHWDFGDGTIGENSAVAAHGWGSSGHYMARCTVSDMKGGVSSHSVMIRVGTPTTFLISGRVYQGGLPVEGVLVKATNNRYDYTDSDGTYTITRLNAGSYSVSAQKYPLSFANPWFSNPVSVGPNNAQNIDFLAVDVELNDVTLVEQNALWKYLDNGSDQGTAWKEPSFDDSGWEEGPAELGYGDDGLGTVVDFGPDANNKYITTYFRRTFTAPDPASITNLLLEVHRDDGVVVYLNGTEILRDNMPGGTITSLTTASGTADGNVFAEVPHALLQAGENVIAAEIHQANGTSSDISFYATMLATSSANLTDLELIYIASPSDKDVLVAPTAVPITVNALNNSGTYTNVEFFVDGNKVAEDDTEPFATLWSSPELGAHTLSVVAYDLNGIATTPPAVRVNIVNATGPSDPSLTLIAQGSSWKYLDNGSDQGTDWKESNFDDAGWNAGPAQLGYGDGDEVTTVGFGSSGNAKFITTYFRHAFMVNDLSRIENLSAQLLRDDGAVVYLNGTEVFRSNMPAGTPDFNTVASAGVSGSAEDELIGTLISPSLLVSGLNVLAVEIHQNAPDSSDISFDFSLDAQLTPASTPEVAITSPAANSVMEVAPAVTLQAQATPSSGESILQVTFYAGSTALGTDVDFPYAVDWTNPGVGDYTLTAVATETGGIMHTSAPVQVQVAFPSLPQALVSAGSVWTYLDTGTIPSSDWTELEFDDGAWRSGPGRLGYGDDGEVTTVGYGRTPDAKHITTWFRQTFDVDDPTAFDTIRIRWQRDDAALVYLNGVEVVRDNLLPGVINPNSLAVTSVGGADETTWYESLIDSSLLQPGPNILAVEIHQSSLNSSDLGFDLELAGLVTTNLTQGIYLTEPAQNSVHSSAHPLRLTAYTAGLNGVDKVEFFAGFTKLGESTTSPYSFDWDAPTEGDYELTAQVTIDGDSILVSPAVSVKVTPAPLTIFPVNLSFVVNNSSWFYLDDGTDQGTAWRDSAFDDNSWAFGPARFGYGLDGENTRINAGSITTYYRKTFTVLNPSLLETLSFRLQRDDGAVVYLNGKEIHRSNLPGGEIRHDTLALSTADGLEEQYYHEVTVPVAGSGIIFGRNSLAVEIHQSSANSSDSGFDLLMSGQGSTARRVFLSQPSARATYAKSEPITLEAFASPGTGRTIAKIEFFVGGEKVGEDTSSPYRTQWSTDVAGIYPLTAIATDSTGATLSSSPVEVSVGFEPVSIQLVAPGSNWKYYDQGGDLGTQWAQPGYDDSGWGVGPARLGYGGDGETTTVGFGPNGNDKYPATYFRHAFEVPENATLTSLIFRLQRDDGAIVWFDGAEAYRDNMPAGDINYRTYAASSIPSADEQAWFLTEISVPALTPGTHVVAVAVHQGSAGSSDMGFDLELLGSGLQIALPPPSLSITHLATGQIRIAWPAPSEGWRLQNKFNLNEGTPWFLVPNPVVEIDGQNTVTTSAIGSRFFRLIKQ